MIRRCVSTLLLLCALFSGHLLARQQGHDYFPVPSLEQRLLHEADCDELRSQYDDARRTCANSTAGRTPAGLKPIPAASPGVDQAPLRLGKVFSSSSGLTEATMLPGSGIFRIWFFILPTTCISQGRQSNFSVSTSSP